jgi:hypothetical protein
MLKKIIYFALLPSPSTASTNSRISRWVLPSPAQTAFPQGRPLMPGSRQIIPYTNPNTARATSLTDRNQSYFIYLSVRFFSNKLF